MFEFKIEKKENKARFASLSTPHGPILAPCFIPVGTQASVKSLTSQDLRKLNFQIILANTYHLHLRPGEKIIDNLGGLHKFMNWERPLMTDSGGFQVFSLGVAQRKASQKEKLNKFSRGSVIPSQTSFIRKARDKTNRLRPAKIDRDGVTFYSHLNGERLRLTSKSSIEIQEKLGADLIVAFDDHESPLWDERKTFFSLSRTNDWALESIKAHKRKDQLMYGVVHGGNFKKLRVDSAKFTDKYFNAIAIGGAYSSKEALYEVIDWTVSNVDEQKPRHLLGIGDVVDIFEAVDRGVDFFDCVAPTRRARHASLYLLPKSGGKPDNSFSLQISNYKFATDAGPIDKYCFCFVCQSYSRAYLNHLFRAKELLAFKLATYHNLFFIGSLMNDIREAILRGKFAKMKELWLK